MGKRVRMAVALVALLLAAAFVLPGCGKSQMAAMAEELETAETPAEGVPAETGEGKKEEKEASSPEEEYIDADYAAAMYGEDADEDLSRYEEKKSAPAGASGSAGTAYGDVGDAEPAEGQDAYHTDPVPEGMPEPVEPQDTSVNGNESHTCTLYVECSTILNNMGDLTAGKEGLVPSDGVIYGISTVTFYEGESVYDVLIREMQNNRIHTDANFTPMYNSAYVKAINNLYEKDCGRWSGWMYCVNGWYPNYGCSRYQIQDGDAIEWHYTCDLGRDLGAEVSGNNG